MFSGQNLHGMDFRELLHWRRWSGWLFLGSCAVVALGLVFPHAYWAFLATVFGAVNAFAMALRFVFLSLVIRKRRR